VQRGRVAIRVWPRCRRSVAVFTLSIHYVQWGYSGQLSGALGLQGLHHSGAAPVGLQGLHYEQPPRKDRPSHRPTR
jgi:hypothetical protein